MGAQVTAECWDSSCRGILSWRRDGSEHSGQEFHQHRLLWPWAQVQGVPGVLAPPCLRGFSPVQGRARSSSRSSSAGEGCQELITPRKRSESAPGIPPGFKNSKSLEFLKRVGSILTSSWLPSLLPAVPGRAWCARVLHGFSSWGLWRKQQTQSWSSSRIATQIPRHRLVKYELVQCPNPVCSALGSGKRLGMDIRPCLWYPELENKYPVV